MTPSLAPARRVLGRALNLGLRRGPAGNLVKTRVLLSAILIVTVALGLSGASAFGAGGRLQL